MVYRTDISLLLPLLLLLTACYGHKELEYGGPAEVHVSFDWTQHPNTYPESMLMYVYAENDIIHPYAFAGREGGSMTLPEGTYRMMCMNNDTENIRTRGETWETFELYTSSTRLSMASAMFVGTRNVPRAPSTEEQLVVVEPDMVYTGVNSGFTTEPRTTQSLSVPITTPIQTYNIEITNVSNLKYVSDLTATISGMAGSAFPTLGTISSTPCIIPFEMESDNVSVITGSVRSFGRQEDDDAEHYLVVYAQLRDGGKYYYTFNVTEEMKAAGDKQSVTLELEGLPWPKPITNGSGLQPVLDEWQEVVEEIHM